MSKRGGAPEFFDRDVQKLVLRYKCVISGGDYVEK
jgi:hypothetical protein